MEETIQTVPEHGEVVTESKNLVLGKGPLALGVLALVILLGVGMYFWSQSNQQDSVQEFTYSETSPLGEVAKLLQNGALVAPAFDKEGIVADYAVQGVVHLALVRTLAATSTEVNIYRPFDTDLYLLGEESKRLTTDGTAKGWLSLSGDGTHAAYAFVDAKNPLAATNPGPTDWSVAVVSVAGGEVTVLGRGVSPKFLGTGDTVVFATLTGLRSYNLPTGESTAYDLPQLASAFSSFDLSPDGKYLVVRDPATGQHAVYAVEGSLSELKLVGKIPSLTAAALTNKNVFGLKPSTSNVAAVRSYSLQDLGAEGKLFATLPEGSSVTRITPQY